MLKLFKTGSSLSSQAPDSTNLKDGIISTGTIVTPDASSFSAKRIPGEYVERIEYVPKSFTKDRISAIEKDYRTVKSQYDERLDSITKLHEKNIGMLKKHYEDCILEMKSNAVRHVNIQEKMRKELEVLLNAEIRRRDTKIEEMRDTAAENTRLHQEEVRGLKAKLSASEILSKDYKLSLDNLQCDSACSSCLSDALRIVEINHISNSYESELCALRTSFENELKLKKEEFDQARSLLNKEIALLEYDKTIRLSCETVMSKLLCQVEESHYQEAQKLNNYKIELFHLEAQSRVDAMMIAKESERLSQLFCSEGVDRVVHDYHQQQNFQSLQLHQDSLKNTNALVVSQILESIVDDVFYRCQINNVERLYEIEAQNNSLKRASLLEQFRSFSVKSECEILIYELINNIEIAGLESKFQSQLQRESERTHDLEVLLKEANGKLSKERTSESSQTDNVRIVEAGQILFESEQEVIEIAVARVDCFRAISDIIAIMEKKQVDSLENQVGELTQLLHRAEERSRKTKHSVSKLSDNSAHSLTQIDSSVISIAPAKDLESSKGREMKHSHKPSSTNSTPRGSFSAKDSSHNLHLMSFNSNQHENSLMLYEDLLSSIPRIISATSASSIVQSNIIDIRGPIALSPNGINSETDDFRDNKVSLSVVDSVDSSNTDNAKKPSSTTPLVSCVERISDYTQTDALEESKEDDEEKELPHHPDDIASIEQLEDQLLESKNELEKLNEDKKKMEDEKNFIQQQMQNLINEKRTDVLKRYEDDLESLRKQQVDQTQELVTLRAEKSKFESRLKELQSRAESAEKELKDRDSQEIQALPTHDEKVKLRSQIKQQRDEIVMKSKAATAGWDAAADADERLEKEVEKAYYQGLSEGKKQQEDDLASLHEAIEKKETRLTELVVKISEMEYRVKESEDLVSKYKLDMENVKQEAAETISLFTGEGGGGGGAVSFGPTEKEVEELRELLDNSQEEVIDLNEKCEKMKEKVDLCEQRIAIYEQLIEAQKKASTSNSISVTDSKANLASSDLNDIVSNVKQAITKGTNLWKINRKEECYDLYLTTCENCAKKLIGSGLKQPLLDAASSVKNQTTNASRKPIGATALRKALDKFLVDCQLPSFKSQEEMATISTSASAPISTDQASSALSSEETRGLHTQLAVLNSLYKNTDSSLTETKKNEENAPMTEQRSPESSGSASLLKRAKDAEALVEKLRRQMNFLMNATGATEPPLEETMNQAAREKVQSTENSPENGDEIEPSSTESTEKDGKSENEDSTTQEISSKSVSQPVSTTSKTVTNKVGASKAAPASNSKGGGSGMEGAEMRKLQRRIKELEVQLQSKSSAENSNDTAEKKALQLAEKQLQKKLKDMESAFKKEKSALESKAIKSEKTLEAANALLEPITKERDQLRGKVKDITTMTAELENLRKMSEKYQILSQELDQKKVDFDMLTEQFKKEQALRKKYKNELEDLKGAIRVYARCRPMAGYEIERGCKNVIQFKDDTSFRVQTNRGEKEFEFDSAFQEDSTQDQVFEDTKRLVESCLDGYNVCVFAYGQTGSGKTFTMTGSASMPGLTPRAIDEIYRLIKERTHCTSKVTTYFVELYNDNLVDLYWLLDNKKNLRNTDGTVVEPPKLEIKMDAKKMVFIRNAVIKDASSPEDLMNLFNLGNAERHVGATKMNAESSRSHSIFAIMVESFDSTTKRTTMGKLSLVDLAGSERQDKTGATADRLREALSINKSLSALGDVISALSEGEKFIPYRNNKLTQLMQDSLGGNAKTLMFVNYSPADYNVDETFSSLTYAARVKKIVNNASKQAESEEVARLKRIIKKLQSGQAVSPDEIVEDGGNTPADDNPDATPLPE